jgi:hypothetical protein
MPKLDDRSDLSLVRLITNTDYFPTESDKKTYVFACTTSKTIILLETTIKTEDNPENMFSN